MLSMTREEFFARLAPFAIRARREGSPMFPSVRLAQNLLETGGVIHPWNNLGGIKVGSGRVTPYWRGASVNRKTWEVYDGRKVNISADFRAYDTLYDYYKDQDLLLQLPRYERVRNADTPEEQARMLQASGYATDPQYASKLINIINQYNLKRFDNEAAVDGEAVPAQVLLEGKIAATGYLVEGQTWVPARHLGKLLGLYIGWNGKEVTVNGKPRTTRIFEGRGYVPVRELAEAAGAAVQWEQETRTVRLSR
ncbi:hypothetical protein DNH61_10760 [Paenibacillus sambharensis]|uniref:Mannosyl-glycoprotein endo-beta-N-acetylglucosamidase-like domain-containing protein n=1 Tax=Paenibacillus sambharensis TaxID=1803190 RepID=A0A2W1LAJ6_9BACL|nr:glucosaminidase domain-containing protein [Paenibacillus sambharensis]PZD95913.1 hypothetical protein DNH61_10760 [Paenibacillus sambharensis]